MVIEKMLLLSIICFLASSSVKAQDPNNTTSGNIYGLTSNSSLEKSGLNTADGIKWNIFSIGREMVDSAEDTDIQSSTVEVNTSATEYKQEIDNRNAFTDRDTVLKTEHILSVETQLTTAKNNSSFDNNTISPSASPSNHSTSYLNSTSASTSNYPTSYLNSTSAPSSNHSTSYLNSTSAPSSNHSTSYLNSTSAPSSNHSTSYLKSTSAPSSNYSTSYLNNTSNILHSFIVNSTSDVENAMNTSLNFDLYINPIEQGQAPNATVHRVGPFGYFFAPIGYIVLMILFFGSSIYANFYGRVEEYDFSKPLSKITMYKNMALGDFALYRLLTRKWNQNK